MSTLTDPDFYDDYIVPGSPADLVALEDDNSDDISPDRGPLLAVEALADPFAIVVERPQPEVVPDINLAAIEIESIDPTGTRKRTGTTTITGSSSSPLVSSFAAPVESGFDLTTTRIGQGHRVTANIVEAVTDAELARNLEGESTLTLTLSDPIGNVRRSQLLAGIVNLHLDGRDYRLVNVRKSGTLLTLTFSTLGIVRLKAKKGFKRAWRRTHKGGKGMTRAEFVLSLIREVGKPKIPVTIPELHQVRQTEKFTKPPRRKAQNRERGIGQGLTIKGRSIDNVQRHHLERALTEAESLAPMPIRAWLALLCAGIGESNFRPVINSLGYGGVFQGQVNVGGRYFSKDDTEAEAHYFLVGGKGYQAGGAIHLAKTTNLSPGDIATRVEASGQPGSFYGAYEDEARAILNDFSGGAGGSLTFTRIKKYAFKRGKDEDSWTCIQRLAEEVGWRAFFVGNRFYWISDQDLYQSRSRMTISEASQGVDVIDYEYDRGHPVAELTVQCRGNRWFAPPGTLVTIQDVASQVDGKWLVFECSRKLASVNCSVTLRRPLAELPEPQPETEDVTSGSVAERALEAARRIGSRHYPYVWGGGHARAGSPSGGGYDCSGGTAAVLEACGIAPKSWQHGVPSSGVMAQSWGKPGKGKTLTVWANGVHVFMIVTVEGRRFHLGTGDWGKGWSGYGVNKTLHPTAGFTPRHWPGV